MTLEDEINRHNAAVFDDEGREIYQFKEGGTLCKHSAKYLQSVCRIKLAQEDYGEIDRIEKHMKSGKIDIIKYRNSFNSVNTGSEVKDGYL